MSSRSSSRAASDNVKDEPLLPYSSMSEKAPLRIRSVLSHCLYRRVLIWTVTSLLLVSIVLYSTKDAGIHKAVGHYEGKGSAPHPGLDGSGSSDSPSGEFVISVPEEEEDQVVTEEDRRAKKAFDEDVKKMPWMRFKHLNAYFHGLKTLVPKSEHIPEYPNTTRSAPFPNPPKNNNIPEPEPYNPYWPDAEAQTCYLDSNNSVPVPSLYAYNGVPQHLPDPAIGSYKLLGIRDDVCFDRFGRYGPYGLGYTKRKGGSGVGLDTESSGSSAVWEESGMIDYSEVDWADAQERCVESNKHRFRDDDPEVEEANPTGKMGRTAIVIRTYSGFKWTEHAILNFRALISELSLASGGEYSVHFLLHVRDEEIPVWADDVTVQRLLDANVPPEFHGIVTLWSEPQMRLYYPGKFGDAYSNPSGHPIHGVYRSAHFPLQIFAMQHPEYDHFWNWEMDMRYIGNYYELFDRMGKWAQKQPRSLIWERSARYYIPPYHGTWENFTKTVERDHLDSGLSSAFGPLRFQGRKSLRFEAKGGTALPDDCDTDADRSSCGIGEEADLITVNPIFDTEQSGWVFGLDAVGYASTPPPRRAAIITASRLSRRLLLAMHEEVWRHHHTMFSEMFPPSVAFHHGFKAVFAPHPIHIDRAWDPLGSVMDAAFNGGQFHSTNGEGSPFDLANEHNHKGTSWYFNSEFAGMLWRRWLGYAQKDGRGKFGGHGSEGKVRGGVDEEKSEDSSGRMCLRSMLLHPIKHEHPSETA